MKTECTPVQIEFTGLGRRTVRDAFDGGHIGLDGGAVLLREVDARLGITQKLAACFTDHRDPDLIEHDVTALVRLWFSTAAYTLINPLRRVLIHFASACPYQPLSQKVWQRLQHYPLRR